MFFGVQVRRVLRGIKVTTRHLKRTVRIAGITDLPMERLKYVFFIFAFFFAFFFFDNNTMNKKSYMK